MSKISSIHTESAAATVVSGDADLEPFKSLYRVMNRDTLNFEMLDAVYTEDFVFKDAFHHVEGLNNYYSYCHSMYENVSKIEFDFHEQWADAESATISWTMRFHHKRIRGGKEVAVDGISVLKFDQGKICSQRDYFDGGQALYDHLPLLGTVIGTLKKRMSP